MTMNKAIHPSNDRDRLYVSRKEGACKIVSIEDCVDTLTQGVEEYIKTSKK